MEVSRETIDKLLDQIKDLEKNYVSAVNGRKETRDGLRDIRKKFKGVMEFLEEKKLVDEFQFFLNGVGPLPK